MSTRKAIGGSIGAIFILIISQTIAGVIASGLVLLHISMAICNAVAGLLYIIVAYLLLKQFSKKILKIEMESLGIPRVHINKKWIAVAFLLPLAVKGIYLSFPGEFVSSGMDNPQILSTLSAGIFYTGIAAAFVEEMVFRGFILTLLKNRWNKKIAILVPSVLFGIVHIIGMNFTVFSCLLVIIAGTMVGIMFSLIELESNSIWNSGFVHVVWNVIIIGGGLAINGAQDKYSVMTYVLNSKNIAITGGEFGIESSIIAVIGYLIVCIWTFYIMKRKK